MYERIDKYASEISDIKSSLNDKYKDQVKKKIDNNPYLVTGPYHLTYGEYDYVMPKDPSAGYKNDEENEQNEENSTSGEVIVLNNDGTIVIGGKTYRYSVNSNVLNIDNGSSIRVSANDKFTLSDNGGMNFQARNPYVEPVDNQNNNNDSNNNVNNNESNSSNNEENNVNNNQNNEGNESQNN